MSYPRVAGVITAQGVDRSALLNDAADAQGMPPQLLLGCGIGESDLDEHASRFGPWPDVSFGMFQQTVAYAPIGDQSASPENVAYVRDQLFDVTTAALIAAPQLGHYWGLYEDGPEALGRYNWPARGLEGNPNRANIERAWRQAAAYLVGPAVSYNAEQAPERQAQDWTCSVRTATWLAKSIGGTTDAAAMQDAMVAAGLVTPALGLLDGSGGDLATFLAAHTGQPTGHAWLDWEAVAARAGRQPIGMGSPTMYHWLAVRDVQADGSLRLMNPAPEYRGVGEVLDEAAFRRWAPWAVVWLAVEDPAVIAELEAEIRRLEGELAAEKSWGTALLAHVVVPSYDYLTQALATEPVDRIPTQQAHTLLGDNGGKGQ